MLQTNSACVIVLITSLLLVKITVQKLPSGEKLMSGFRGVSNGSIVSVSCDSTVICEVTGILSDKRQNRLAVKEMLAVTVHIRWVSTRPTHRFLCRYKTSKMKMNFVNLNTIPSYSTSLLLIFVYTHKNSDGNIMDVRILNYFVLTEFFNVNIFMLFVFDCI